MRKNDIKKLREEPVGALQKKAQALQLEIATMRVNVKNNPPKDTSIMSKKVKELAIVLTLAHQKNV